MNRTARLKPILANLTHEHQCELRDAYHKAVEGLAALHELMAEASDLDRGLAGELRHIRAAKQELNRSGLGEIL